MTDFTEAEALTLLEAEEKRRQEQEECDHDFDPDEGFTCLICGLDGTEEVMSRACDRMKDFRRFGE